ncbi:MAG TPA: hypothetical protein VLD19_05110 [Chitinophagaceae bacterium]|nr:hypothetical protein [Chitinophagaceae bacterium]
MKRTFNNLGGLQSLFFCVGIYTVALFFSIFVCSSVFYALNPHKSSAQASNQTKVITQKPVYASVER